MACERTADVSDSALAEVEEKPTELVYITKWRFRILLDMLETCVKRCADCGKKTKVIDSREQDNGVVVRLRKCENCGYEFRTVEIEEIMIDHDGLLAEINRLTGRIKTLTEYIAGFKKSISEILSSVPEVKK